ncbi:hypothetical protein GE21DRAFT_9801 [Neurospora crassa]|nr:hypothetical protein GE21DRAFT_9801 [Neurospora crassa]
MADRGVKRNFDMVDPSSDSGDTTINNKSTRNMRESAPSPPTASDSEPRFHPTTNDSTTGDDMSQTADPSSETTISSDTTISKEPTRNLREANPSPTSASDSEPRFHPTTNNPTTGGADMSWAAGPSNQATTSNVNPASNANIGYPDDTATLLRASYHTRQAAAIVLPLIARRLALMKMVNQPDFPERFERFQRGEVDVESGEEADDEMEKDDEDMGEAEEEMDTEETEEAAEEMDTEETEEAGEKMDTESRDADDEMDEDDEEMGEEETEEAGEEMDTEETEEAGEEMDTEETEEAAEEMGEKMDTES